MLLSYNGLGLKEEVDLNDLYKKVRTLSSGWMTILGTHDLI